MNDILALCAFLAALVIVIGLCWPGGFFAWVRNEIALARADQWSGDYLVNPALGSMADPNVARMDMKRKRLGKRMKKQGRSLLTKKAYTPVLTKKTDDTTPAPRADKIVPIRRRA